MRLTAAYLSSRWAQSQWEYERIWARVDELPSEDVLKRLEEIRLREAEWDHVARREMPRDSKLQEATFAAMLADRAPETTALATAAA